MESIIKNYNPVNVIFNSLHTIDLASLFVSNAKTIVIIPELLSEKWPNLHKCFPKDVHLISDITRNPDYKKIDQIQIPSQVTQVIGIGGGSVLNTAKALFAKILTKCHHVFQAECLVARISTASATSSARLVTSPNCFKIPFS